MSERGSDTSRASSRSPSTSSRSSSDREEYLEEKGARDTKRSSRKTKPTNRPFSRQSPESSRVSGASTHRDTYPQNSGLKKTPRAADAAAAEEKYHHGNRRSRDSAWADEEGRDYAAEERGVRWPKLEPKFEPRYRCNNTGTSIGGVRQDTAYYYAHRRKVALARPVVDNRPPQLFSHIYCNMKKLRIHQDRQDTIEKENKMLLGKLVNAMTTARVDNRNSNSGQRNSHARWQQKQNSQISQIEAENRRMQARIDSRRSTNDKDKDREQWSSSKDHQSQTTNEKRYREKERQHGTSEGKNKIIIQH